MATTGEPPSYGSDEYFKYLVEQKDAKGRDRSPSPESLFRFDRYDTPVPSSIQASLQTTLRHHILTLHHEGASMQEKGTVKTEQIQNVMDAVRAIS